MATEDEILARLAELVHDIVGVSTEDVQMDKSFTDDLDVDSLSIIEIVYACEDAYEVSIPDDAIKEMKTVGDAVRYIHKELTI
ncbi:MAG TPA: acyl carrier protein [Candidatus Saccharimonas sp.]|nr:acyl carrier protein [Candidatus Saccharimonas sp.]